METLFTNRQWWLDDERKPSPYIKRENKLGHTQFREISKFPFVVRHMTVKTEKSVNDCLLDILSNMGKYVEVVRLIGEYKDESKRTLTFEIIFQALQRTLTKEEVDECMNKIEKAI